MGYCDLFVKNLVLLNSLLHFRQTKQFKIKKYEKTISNYLSLYFLI